MFSKTFRFSFVAGIFIIFIGGWAFTLSLSVPTVNAQTISPGCAEVNAGGFNAGGINTTNRYNRIFYAGDVLTSTATNIAGTPLPDAALLRVQIVSGGPTEIVSVTPGDPAIYTIPQSGLIHLITQRVETNGLGQGSATFTMTCQPSPNPPVGPPASAGCDAINAGDLNGTDVTETSITNLNFNAGELIITQGSLLTYSLGITPAGSTETVIPGNSVTGAQYTIPQTGTYAQIRLFAAGVANFTAICYSVDQIIADALPDGFIIDPPDHRRNAGLGDLYGVIYPAQDDNGDPAIHVYCINAAGDGYLALVITAASLDGIPAPPAQNTLVSASDGCNVAFYALSSGEYQINLGLTPGGVVHEFIFNGLAMNDIFERRFYLFNPFD